MTRVPGSATGGGSGGKMADEDPADCTHPALSTHTENSRATLPERADMICENMERPLTSTPPLSALVVPKRDPSRCHLPIKRDRSLLCDNGLAPQEGQA